MKLSSNEKVAIITGASSGIGRATAISFAQSGVKVVVAARRIKEGEETVCLAKDAGSDAIFVQTDVTKATDVNLKSVWLCLKYQIPAMLKTEGGAVVNMASMGGGVIGVPGLSSYNAAKGGVVGLTKSAAMEFAEQGIRINAISPGLIATDIFSNVTEEVLQQMVESIPLKRAGQAEEIASAVIWLCSEGASYITGQNLVIDGGFTVQ